MVEARIRQIIGFVIACVADGVRGGTIIDMATSSLLDLVSKVRAPGELTLEEQGVIAAADSLAWHLKFDGVLVAQGCNNQEHINAYTRAKAALLISKGVEAPPEPTYG